MSNLVADWIRTILHSVYPRADEAGTDALAELVRVPKPEEVRRYLSRHPGFQEPVRRLCVAVRKEFGPESDLSLEVYHDPEIDDHHLTVYVREPSYPAGFMARIDRVMAPFEEELSQQSGWVLVTTDCRPPRKRNGV